MSAPHCLQSVKAKLGELAVPLPISAMIDEDLLKAMEDGESDVDSEAEIYNVGRAVDSTASPAPSAATRAWQPSIAAGKLDKLAEVFASPDAQAPGSMYRPAKKMVAPSRVTLLPVAPVSRTAPTSTTEELPVIARRAPPPSRPTTAPPLGAYSACRLPLSLAGKHS